MYFAHGWPKVLSVLDGASQEDVVYLHSDIDFLVVVSTTSIQLWTGSQHRVKLGLLTRDQASLRAEGLNRKAFWSSNKKLLAVLVPSMLFVSGKGWARALDRISSGPAPCSCGLHITQIVQGWYICYSGIFVPRFFLMSIRLACKPLILSSAARECNRPRVQITALVRKAKTL